MHADAAQSWTLGFAGLGAVAGTLSWWEGRRKRMTDERAEAAQESAKWSLTMTALTDSGLFRAVVRFEAATAEPLQLLSVAPMQPRGTKIARAKNIAGGVNDRPKYVPDGALQEGLLVLGQSLSPGLFVRPGAVQFVDQGSIGFVVQVPQRPWLSRAERARVRIVLHVEESSAAIRRRQIIVSSQLIPWTANKAAKAT